MFVQRAGLLLAVLAGGWLIPSSLWAQTTNGGTTVTPAAGVQIDAAGVLTMKMVNDPFGRLTKQRMQQGKAMLAVDLAKPSPLRKVSLTRLEAAIAERKAAGKPPTDDMANLAGLTRIQYVFCYPDTKDIVIAGPAEGFAADPAGRIIGTETGAATLLLEDLVTALRAYPPSGQRTTVIRCSIDPTQQGLKDMREFLGSLKRVGPGDANFIAAGLREKLGLQTIVVNGVSTQTHFAQVLVEADYRMKLIGIGLENPPVKIPSYVSKANPAMIAANALQRWYFTPNYECVKVSDDALAMELVGQGVKLIGEDELVNSDGSRAVAGKQGNRASQIFTEAFTEKYAELAKKSPVYAQLKNCVDLAVAAAFIQDKDYYGRTGWTMALFGKEENFKTETCPSPKQVGSAVNIIWKTNSFSTPIGGGVQIQPRKALAKENLVADARGEVVAVKEKIDLSKLQKGQWWWD